MMISLSDLITPATQDQIRANLVATLKKLGIPADKWRQSGSLSSILTAVSASIAAFSLLLSQAIAGQFLNLATGGWLTLLAFYVYGVQRTEATFASGNYTLTNGGGGVWNFAPGTVTFLNQSTGQTYTNTTAIALGVVGSSTATQTIGIQATSAGAAGGALIGAVNTIVTPMAGVSGTNGAPIVGLDEQSDPDLRATCFAKLGASSVRGPTGAYKYYATHNPDGSPLLNDLGAPVNINRVSVSNASHTGNVTVTIAAPQGLPTVDDYNAALANITANARVSATTLVVQLATPVNYNPALVISCKSVPGLSVAALQTAAENAISSFLATYDIGGLALAQPASSGVQQGLFGSAIDGVIAEAIQAAGSFVVDVDGLFDLPMTAGQVAVNATTATVRLVSSAS